MKFAKYHALGNDYLVINPEDMTSRLTQADIKILCDRHYGVGSDGILLGPADSDSCDFSLKIFNPDASEAEKSGNGLRIFARYLWDQGLVFDSPFSIQTKGGAVTATVGEKGQKVTIGMGKVRFTHEPETDPDPASLSMQINGDDFTYYLANVGNPHCVIFVEKVHDGYAKEIGSVIEKDKRFPNRTNVQFVEVINRSCIKIEIWERGAGYTLASGSSSTAAATVACALGFCDSPVDVQMPGGIIKLSVDKQCNAVMTGAVSKVFEGYADEELFILRE